MKKVLLLFILSAVTYTVKAQTILVQDFESGVSGYTTSVDEFTDGERDYFINTNGSNVNVNYNNQTGNYFGAQDTDGDGQPSSLLLNIVNTDISSLINLNLCIDLAEDDDSANQDWDADTELKINYEIDGGGYQDGIHVQSVGGTNTEPAIDSNYDGVGDSPFITNTFTQHCVSIPNGALLNIEIIFEELNAGDEDIAIDNILITGELPSGTPGITLTDPAGNTSESGTTTTFTAVLNSMPTTNVVLDVTSGNTAENTVSPAMLIFTSTNWETPQTITVTGVDDSDFDGDQTTTITVATNDAMSDDAYDGLSESKDVINQDDEVITTCLDDITCEFEIVPVVLNSQMDNWSCTAGSYNVNGFTGTSGDNSELWLIYGELDMTASSFATLNFDLAEGYTGSQIEVMWTNSYTGCPGDAGNAWTSLGVYMDAVTGESIDISTVTGTTVYIGFKYTADGAGGGSSDFTLSNITTEADVCPTVNTPLTSSCVLPTEVNFASLGSTIAEDGGSIDVCVSIANPSSTAASTVDITMDASSTATNGDDFTMITFPNTITFPAGSSTDVCLTIDIIDDVDMESTENIVLNLVNPTGGNTIALGTDTQTTISITDNDTPALTNDDVRINELDSDQAGTDSAEFIELFGTPNLVLDGLVVVLFNGGDDLSYASYDLDGFALDPNGFLLIGTAGAVDFTPEINLNSSGIQNGAEGVGLYIGNASDFPNDTPISQSGLIDALVHKSGEGDDTGLNPLIENQPFLDDATEEYQVDEDLYNDSENQSIQRGSWFVSAPTPRLTNVLPVDFISFEGMIKDNQSILTWATAQEVNNEKFEIERSSDTKEFETISEIKGNGNTTSISEYTFTDENPISGPNYYRLKQVDLDGAFDYSKVVKVDHTRGAFRISPTSTSSTVEIANGTNKEYTFEVISSDGKIITKTTTDEVNRTIDMADLENGMYFIRIQSNQTIFTEKVIKF